MFKMFEALKAGKMVANPAAWKRGQVTVNQVLLVVGFGAGFLKGTKYEMPDSVVYSVGVGLFGLVNWLFTVATTDKIGITGAPTVARPAGDSPAPAASPTQTGMVDQSADPANVAGG